MRETFERIIEQRDWTDKKLPIIMRNIRNRLGRRLPEGREPELTVFQREVINDPDFWRDWGEDAPVRNLMIQGATSAGKTLVSELAILDTIRHGKKAIVLVPLKAMVHERTRQFREDMSTGLPDGDVLRVFGSSSDYMENDEQIIGGSFEVAIIVYEKFFAMLSQGNKEIMKDCGLLVVDELSMLSLEQRGPKLEMALEIVRSRFPETRIMCLVTCDCSTEKICQWLDIHRPIISTARPVALEEHILHLNGKGLWRHIPENHNALQAGNRLAEYEEEISVSGYQPEARDDEKIKKLLLAVLAKLYRENPEARVLVFTDARDRTAALADFLRENASVWRPDLGQGVDTELMDALSTCDRDEGQAHLIDTLLPAGIAYHHAGLSATLREIIEEHFQRQQSGLRVIVATETLTVGVNLPFDAMIMTTYLVNRGKGERVALSSQEYRNFIGRAGRLGQSNQVGKTYLFARDSASFDRYWKSYYQRDEIKTALSKADEATLAPYYLSLINSKVGSDAAGSGTTFTLDRLDQLYEQSLAKACGARAVNAEKLQDVLYDAYLSDRVAGGKPRGRGAAAVPEYALESFGAHLAPYAFSRETCIRIYQWFFEGYANGGLKSGLTREDVASDKYLLDILYHVCCHPEIANSSSIPYPQNDHNTRNTYLAKDRVLQALTKLLEEKDEQEERKYSLMCQAHDRSFWQESHLWLLQNRPNNTDENVMLQAALRAIVLFYWTQGYTVEELKKKTGFGDFVKLVAGDIERLAEMAAFHLDAIHKCLTTARDMEKNRPVYADETAERAFYELQTRVKYGMPRELAKFANKHIHGLDRKRLLRLKKLADKENLSPLQYLFVTPPGRVPAEVLTISQHTRLRFAMERRGNVKQIKMVMEIIQNDVGAKLKPEEQESLRAIADWAAALKPEDTSLYREMEENLFLNLENVMEYEAFRNIELSTYVAARCIEWKLSDGDHSYKLQIGVLCHNGEDERLKKFFEKPADAKLLVVPSTFDTEDMDKALADYYACGVRGLVNNIYLTFVLGKTILMSLDGGAALTHMLGDLRGSFTMADYNYCPLPRFMREDRQKERPVPRYRFLFGSGGERRESGEYNTEEMARKLSADETLGACEILPWGNALTGEEYNFAECPTILTVTRKDVTRSHSLTQFVYKMSCQGFKNCILLLENVDEEFAWNDGERREERGNTEWRASFTRITKAVVSDEGAAMDRIRSYLQSWQQEGFLIGISYAHYSEVEPEDREACKSGNDILQKLAEALAEEYGEHRIFFDQLPTASSVFGENKNREKSLAAYRACVVGVVLWNYWTKENENCKAELDILLEKSVDDKMCCLFLQTNDSGALPKLPEGYYTQTLTDSTVSDLVRSIKKQVEKRI